MAAPLGEERVDLCQLFCKPLIGLSLGLLGVGGDLLLHLANLVRNLVGLLLLGCQSLLQGADLFFEGFEPSLVLGCADPVVCCVGLDGLEDLPLDFGMEVRAMGGLWLLGCTGGLGGCLPWVLV